MIILQFQTGGKQTYKADSADVKDGVLRLLRYTKDRSKVLVTNSFTIDTIRWARLSNGTYVVGSEEHEKWD